MRWFTWHSDNIVKLVRRVWRIETKIASFNRTKIGDLWFKRMGELVLALEYLIDKSSIIVLSHSLNASFTFFYLAQGIPSSLCRYSWEGVVLARWFGCTVPDATPRHRNWNHTTERWTETTKRLWRFLCFPFIVFLFITFSFISLRPSI